LAVALKFEKNAVFSKLLRSSLTLSHTPLTALLEFPRKRIGQLYYWTLTVSFLQA